MRSSFSPPSERDAEPRSEIHEKGRGPVLPRPGYDAVVTSPPYAGSQFETGDKPPEFWEEMARRQKRPAWADLASRTRKTRDA